MLAGLMQASLLLSFIGFCFSLNFAMQGVNFTVADAKRGQAALERVFKVRECSLSHSTWRGLLFDWGLSPIIP